MQAIFYHPTADFASWQKKFKEVLPSLTVFDYKKTNQSYTNDAIDFAFVWAPPIDMLSQFSHLKAVFVLGAGVDAILDEATKHPGYIPDTAPLVRIEDGGMARQMVEYTLARVYHYFRRFDEYDRLKLQKKWVPLDAYDYDNFKIGILGAGILGKAVAHALVQAGFKVKTYSRSNPSIEGVDAYFGKDKLDAFLNDTQLVVNLLPSTPDTKGLIDKAFLSKLNQGSYLINLARGVHVVEDDLLALLNTPQIAGASLDVFAKEPLDTSHGLWSHDKVFMTPHIAAKSTIYDTVSQITNNIKALSDGKPLTGVVDRQRGY